MSLLSLAGVGVGLILLALGIYFGTRKLAMRSIFKEVSRAKSPPAEPLYETPLPKVSKAAVPEKNPLMDFIEGWEEPKPPTEPKAISKPKTKTEPTVKPVPPAEKVPDAERPAPKTEKPAPEKPVDNPLLKFIEEWEEPKVEPKKKK